MQGAIVQSGIFEQPFVTLQAGHTAGGSHRILLGSLAKPTPLPPNHSSNPLIEAPAATRVAAQPHRWAAAEGRR